MGNSGINVTGGPTYFCGSKILTSCIFLGLKNLRIFFGVRISARLIVLTQFKPIVYFFGGLKCPVLYFFGCTI